MSELNGLTHHAPADGSHLSIFPTPETMGTSSSMFGSGASMGTSRPGLNPGFVASDAGVDWVSLAFMSHYTVSLGRY